MGGQPMPSQKQLSCSKQLHDAPARQNIVDGPAKEKSSQNAPLSQNIVQSLSQMDVQTAPASH